MERWTLIGSLAGGMLAIGVRQVADTQPQPVATVAPERTVQALRSQPVSTDLRRRTSGVQCILTSAVRTLPSTVELRTRGQVRTLPVRNARAHTGQAVGEVVLPYPLLDDVDWRLEDLSLTAADGARAELRFDRSTDSCVAALPVAPAAQPSEIRCPIRGGLAAPSVRDVHLWDEDLLPTRWTPSTAAADGDGFLLFDVPATGTAELTVDGGLEVQVRWRDGVCAPVSVVTDAELCVHIPSGDLLHDDPSYGIFIDDVPAVVDPEGVACGQTRMGEAMVTQVWLTGTSSAERSVVVQVEEPARQDVDIAPHAYPTASGALVYPTVDGPRVVSVHGLAEVAGLEDGDIVLAIDERSVVDLPLAEALAPLQGAAAAVSLTVDRNDVELELTVVFREFEDDDDTGM